VSLLDPWWSRPRKSGEPVKVALGAMNFGKRTDEAESKRILARAFERGVTLVDTANAYNDGVSEKIVGVAVKASNGRAGVATKVGFGRIAKSPEGLSRARVLAAIDESLGRLGVDAVELYYLHVPDHATPIEETVDAIGELLAAGKAHAFGVSNYASWAILDVEHACSSRGIARPVASQQLYNVLIRQLDIEYRAFTKVHPIHTTIYNPLAGGLLSGKHQRDGSSVAGTRFDKNAMYLGRYFSDRYFDLVGRFDLFAADHGMTLLELAYRFCASADFVDSILVGPASVAHLDAALDALEQPLAPELVQEIDAISTAFLGTTAKYAR
jgi:aryl-alcohol dehydrogenase-like predicted oxidoreductase